MSHFNVQDGFDDADDMDLLAAPYSSAPVSSDSDDDDYDPLAAPVSPAPEPELGEDELPDWAEMPVDDITFEALSKNGHVRAVIAGGRVESLQVDSSWRTSATPREVEVAVAEAVNAAIDQVYAGVAAQIQHARPVTGLGEVVRDAQQQFIRANDGREDGEMNAALDQLINLLDELPDRIAELPKDDTVVDTQIDYASADDEVNVHVHNGYLTSIATKPAWTRNVSNEDFTQLVADTVDAALEEFRQTQLEQVVSQGEGVGGLVSALFEAQAYVSSGFQMDLENLNFGRKEDVEHFNKARSGILEES